MIENISFQAIKACTRHDNHDMITSILRKLHHNMNSIRQKEKVKQGTTGRERSERGITDSRMPKKAARLDTETKDPGDMTSTCDFVSRGEKAISSQTTTDHYAIVFDSPLCLSVWNHRLPMTHVSNAGMYHIDSVSLGYILLFDIRPFCLCFSIRPLLFTRHSMSMVNVDLRDNKIPHSLAPRERHGQNRRCRNRHRSSFPG